MNPLIGMLASQLGGPVIQQLSQQLGSNENTTQSAVGMALPMLLSAIGNHASTPAGADAIHQVTQADDGSILDNVMDFVGNGDAGGIGSALLDRVVGGNSQNAIASNISQATGMDNGAVTQLLSMITPLIMAAIGKFSQEQGGLDPNGIAQLLGAVGGGNDLLGMATRAIDADGDGNIIEDVENIIGKIF